jgi:hypothetical protein
MFTKHYSYKKNFPHLQISRRSSFVSRKQEKKTNNKEIKFVVVELRGERKVDESNQYKRGKQNSERGGKRWKKYKFNLEIHRPFTFE